LAQAIDLETTNSQYVDIGNQSALDLTSGDWTIETWVKMESYTQYMQIVAKKWQMRMEGVSAPSNVGFYYWNGASFRGWTSTISFDVGSWHHVAVTFDSATTTLYFWIDGADAGNHLESGNPATDSTIATIGFNVGGTSFDGAIQCVRISDIKRYTGAFTPSTVLFSSDANTLGLWWLDGNLTDQSSNSFDGTFQGTGSETYTAGTLYE
jgi:hypothetical protein